MSDFDYIIIGAGSLSCATWLGLMLLPWGPGAFALALFGLLGLVGGMFVAAGQDRKEASFYQAMQFQKFSVKAMLALGLEKRLVAAGYRALSRRTAERAQAPAELRELLEDRQ